MRAPRRQESGPRNVPRDSNLMTIRWLCALVIVSFLSAVVGITAVVAVSDTENTTTTTTTGVAALSTQPPVVLAAGITDHDIQLELRCNDNPGNGICVATVGYTNTADTSFTIPESANYVLPASAVIDLVPTVFSAGTGTVDLEWDCLDNEFIVWAIGR
jgi:hypothetical protein